MAHSKGAHLVGDRWCRRGRATTEPGASIDLGGGPAAGGRAAGLLIPPLGPRPGPVVPTAAAAARAMNQLVMRATFLFALTLAGCSGGTSDPGPVRGTFNVLASEPLNGGRLFLNDPIR